MTQCSNQNSFLFSHTKKKKKQGRRRKKKEEEEEEEEEARKKKKKQGRRRDSVSHTQHVVCAYKRREERGAEDCGKLLSRQSEEGRREEEAQAQATARDCEPIQSCI
jgi:hypothetical protein